MIYKPFFRDDLGYKPRYTQPLHLEEVVVSPIYSESEDYEKDLNSLGYKPIYSIDPEGVVSDDSKSDSTLSYTFASKEDFKSTMLPIYEKVLSEKGINPIFAKSLVAQDGLESAWGSKPSGDNNFGGIKGKGRILKTREVENGKDVYKYQEFRNFASLEDYAKYKVNLLDGKKYKAFDGGLEDFSRRISAGGYATDPRYKEVLNRVIKSVKKGGILKLQQAGKFDSYSDPDHYYDYQNGEYDQSTGHWYSRNPVSGLELKNPNHPTHKISQYYDHKEGLKRFKNEYTGRYYTLEEWSPGRHLPGMVEVDYELLPNPFDDTIGDYLIGHTKESMYDKYIGYSDMIKKASKEFGVPEKLMIHLGATESNFNPRAVSSKGASGIYQLMPISIKWFKEKGYWDDNLSEDENNIRAGAFILRYFKNIYKDWNRALMGYKGIDEDIIKNPEDPRYESRRVENKIDYLMKYL